MNKLIKIGNSAGFIVPREMLARKGIKLGDELSFVETPQGFEVRPAGDDFDTQMAAARMVMAKRRRALHELAK